MLKFSKFPFTKFLFLFSTVLGMALITNDSLAQSENEKVEDNVSSRSVDKPLAEETISTKESSAVVFPTVKPSTSAAKPSTTVKRDLPSGGLIKEGETKRDSPSTLSFNLFLYIVDKFKED